MPLKWGRFGGFQAEAPILSDGTMRATQVLSSRARQSLITMPNPHDEGWGV
jgi:hypothetical protein